MLEVVGGEGGGESNMEFTMSCAQRRRAFPSGVPWRMEILAEANGDEDRWKLSGAKRSMMADEEVGQAYPRAVKARQNGRECSELDREAPGGIAQDSCVLSGMVRRQQAVQASDISPDLMAHDKFAARETTPYHTLADEWRLMSMGSHSMQAPCRWRAGCWVGRNDGSVAGNDLTGECSKHFSLGHTDGAAAGARTLASVKTAQGLLFMDRVLNTASMCNLAAKWEALRGPFMTLALQLLLIGLLCAIAVSSLGLDSGAHATSTPHLLLGEWARRWQQRRVSAGIHTRHISESFRVKVESLTGDIVEGVLHERELPLQRLIQRVAEWEQIRGLGVVRSDRGAPIPSRVHMRQKASRCLWNGGACAQKHAARRGLDTQHDFMSQSKNAEAWLALPQMDGALEDDEVETSFPSVMVEDKATTRNDLDSTNEGDSVTKPGAKAVAAVGDVSWEDVELHLGEPFQEFIRITRTGHREAAARLAEAHASASAFLNLWDLLLLQREEVALGGAHGSMQFKLRLAAVQNRHAAWIQVARSRESLMVHFGICGARVRRLQDLLCANLDVDSCCAMSLHIPVPARTGMLAAEKNFRMHGLFERAVRSLPPEHELLSVLHRAFRGRREQGTGRVWQTLNDAEIDDGAVTCTHLPSVHCPRVLGARIWHTGGVLIAIDGDLESCGSSVEEDPGIPKHSNFLPPQFRWTDTHRRHKAVDCHCGSSLCPKTDAPDWGSGLKLKSFDYTGVISRRDEWLGGRRIKCVDASCQMILDGKFHFPTVPGGIKHCARSNLGSVDLDKPRLHKLVAKYLIAGSLEFCPPGHRPDNYIPLGLVPKKDEEEPWRVIADGRGMNADLLPWQSTMQGMKASAGLFQPGSFCFLKDFSSAYHNVPLGTACASACVGCSACRLAKEAKSNNLHRSSPSSLSSVKDSKRKRESQTDGCTFREKCTFRRTGLQAMPGDMRPLPTEEGKPGRWVQRKFVGCRPGINCRKVGCQKQSFGIELDGIHFRFAVCHFGVRTSGNAWAALVAPLIREWRNAGARIIQWVDDICVIVPSECRNPESCGGPAICTFCADCKLRTEILDAKFTADIKALGFETNRKDLPATTSAVFLGLGFDTISMTFWVEEEKAAHFQERCVQLLADGKASRRNIAEIVGKLSWWEPAIHSAKLLSRSLQSLTCGKEDASKWEEIVEFSPPALRELRFWRDNILNLARQRMPMIVPKIGHIKDLWMRAQANLEDESWIRAHLATDGGPTHWGAVLTKRDGTRLEASGEYPADARRNGLTAHQAWREGYAAILGLQAFVSEVSSGAVIHDSDCQCVVKAFNEGTVHSKVLQSQAIQMWELSASMGITLFSGWVPGTDIIRSGADGLSREDGLDWHGWGPGTATQSVVQDMAAVLGWKLTVDLFASGDNAKCDRFFARRHCPGVESVNAFETPSWGHSVCPCTRVHRETVYVCPPEPLLLPTWIKLMRDEARGIAVVPKLVGAPWWALLKEAEVKIPGRRTFATFKGKDLSLPTGCTSLNKHGRLDNRQYVVVAFDFRKNVLDNTFCDPCEQAALPRPWTPPLTSEVSRGALMGILAQSIREQGP